MITLLDVMCLSVLFPSESYRDQKARLRDEARASARRESEAKVEAERVAMARYHLEQARNVAERDRQLLEARHAAEEIARRKIKFSEDKARLMAAHAIWKAARITARAA